MLSIHIKAFREKKAKAAALQILKRHKHKGNYF